MHIKSLSRTQRKHGRHKRTYLHTKVSHPLIMALVLVLSFTASSVPWPALMGRPSGYLPTNILLLFDILDIRSRYDCPVLFLQIHRSLHLPGPLIRVERLGRLLVPRCLLEPCSLLWSSTSLFRVELVRLLIRGEWLPAERHRSTWNRQYGAAPRTSIDRWLHLNLA